LYFRPAGFVVFRKKDGILENVFNTLQDPLYSKKYGKIVEELLKKGYFDDEVTRFRIYSTDFYISYFYISYDEKKGISFDWRIDDGRSDSNALKDVLDAGVMDSYREVFNINQELEKVLRPLIDVVTYDDISPFAPYIPAKERDVYLSGVIENIKCAVVDKLYMDVWDSPLISPSRRNPPAVFFFLRSYTRKKTRFRKMYNYDIRFMFSPKQRRDIVEVFDTIADSHNDEVIDCFNRNKEKKNKLNLRGDEKYWYFLDKKKVNDDASGMASYKYVFRRCKGYSGGRSSGAARNRRYPDEVIDDCFWSEVLSKGGPDRIVTAIESPFGDKARSMCDPVFVSGMVHTKYRPFNRGGLERVERSEMTKGVKSPDIMRLVGAHYMFSAMSPRSEDLVIAMVPIFLSGSVWMVIGTITDFGEIEENNVVDDVTYNKFFHFYSDVANRASETARKIAKKSYFMELNKIVVMVMYPVFKNIHDGFGGNVRKEVEKINQYFNLLGRVYPYYIPELKWSDKEVYEEELKKNDSLRVVDVWNDIDAGSNNSEDVFYIKITETSYFPRLVDRRFINPDSIANSIKEGFRTAAMKAIGCDYEDAYNDGAVV
jgi:hypothetical protein